MANRMMKNNEAVSPIVATLILIIVAIVAAAAVMVFMNSYNAKVSNTANNQTDLIVGQMSATATPTPAGSIIIDGSSTLYPAMNTLAQKYMQLNPGVTITVTSSSSGTGKTEIQQGTIDIGMSSDATTVADESGYTYLQVTRVGGCGRVFVVGQGIASSNGHIQIAKADLVKDFDGATVPVAQKATGGITATNGITSVVGRTTGSGTGDTVGLYLYNDKSSTSPIYTSKATKTLVATNALVEAAVAAGTTSDAVLGYMDFGYYNAAHNEQLVDIVDTTTYVPSSSSILSALTSSTSTAYPQGLVGGLFVIYNKGAAPAVPAFVSWITAQQQSGSYTANNVFSLYG